MERISGLVNPSTVLAVIEYPNYEVKHSELLESLTLVLDDIQDPGNLGTIIRLADWFGIDNIVCSLGSADAFSPKVVQASMGAISRVKVAYCNIPDFLREIKGAMPVYGTFMDGSDIYTTSLKPKGLIVMGNEGSGISREVELFITSKLRIPNFAKNRESVESLNVAMATAIICSEFRRR
jgi:TrmH family RNA methyltransferase